VPASIARPHYVGWPAPERYAGDDVQPAEIIEKMRVAGRMAAQAMHAAAEIISPGITTDDLDQVVHEFLIDNGAYPSTLGYRGFPKSCCTSVNEVICHGIPDARPLENGDIIKIDVTAFIGGVHGDTCATFFCGEVDEQAQLLTERTQEALVRAINAVKPGRQVNVIGRVIESYAKRFGYGVVRDYTGHGVHTTFHSGLVIPHYDEPAYDTVMKPGMTFTIEPMITLGSGEWYMWDDGWTVLTADGSWCAQFEHTLVVTENGAEVLTRPSRY
jgi:methionyl aminopeptidase